ncbi:MULTISPECIES: hypothetical protein [Psychrobacter]|uniref:Uncharacterized protein n=1 Tax=Psychrobacter cryohalolentis (strain ATCC BAA-1226 / DSM 17306 / VKM B-2378 / K5) TaxID=335284 RepID=Q1Q7Y5_PSYCK|nr:MULTISPECIES: hypothetical protein [Psychrobacter]ABE76218.1 conserved hypothetical protein [Psychrobacter cryohalolentis K5]ASE26395.1 hypothetical protein CEP87_07310 [Psychrobacter cryohalolentis]KAA0927196.1 hypothetical protein FQ082_04945 [Psychrobacter sp. ANT_H56B]KAA0939206.1 hypothetical protein FQ083_05480 [Psychrobacter sp. ANT_H59]WAI89105.1 hypothetical protein SC65A3_02597 [Psychrobacter sp. SC65A.3]
MDFYLFKNGVVSATGLEKDALHIYVGISVYLLSVILLRPIFKKYSIRAFIALIMVTCIALLGEYLDNRQTITELGLAGIESAELMASIHDIINTCMLSYVLYGLTMWTKIFQSISTVKPMIKRQKKTDYS